MKKILLVVFVPVILFSSGINTHYHMINEVQNYVEDSYKL